MADNYFDEIETRKNDEWSTKNRVHPKGKLQVSNINDQMSTIKYQISSIKYQISNI